MAPILNSHDDDALALLMTDLGGHCIASLLDAYAQAASDDRPCLIIAYTVKGRGLPFAGHKDNHAGLMTPTQIEGLRDQLGIAAGQEWEKWAGLGDNQAAALKAFVANSPAAALLRDRSFDAVSVPAIPAPAGEEQATQSAFGRILFDLAKAGGPLADRIVTTSPDVTVSTGLGPWVNARGLFRRQQMPDVFRAAKIPSPQKWQGQGSGQHVELGIAEHNLFLVLAAAGLTAPLFGTRLIPIGTVYDPFIARGLDALNYGCYQDARFILVATPSGVTLGPEGGAHQSINPPLIAMGQPGLTHYEPAYADELALLLHHAFGHVQDPDGESVYFRLSTRSIAQVPRADDDWQAGAIAGGYWLRKPSLGAEAAIVAMGALMPEALAAWEALIDDIPGLGLLAVTSPDLLHRGWRAGNSHVEALLAPLRPGGRLVTLCDAAPASLSWLGGVHGHRVVPLGVDRFGQTGDLVDLFAAYALDEAAIITAMATALSA
nr:hypothetical protein [Sandarakinorhabdus sp.]